MSRHYIIEHGVEITTRVFIGNIPYSTNESELKEFFSQYGAIKDCNIVTDRKGISKGYGFVTFKDELIAKKVLQMAKVEFNHKTLNICRAIRKKNTGQYNGSNAEYLQAESNPVSIINYQGRNFFYNNGILEPLNNEPHQTGIMLYSAVVLPPSPSPQYSPSVPQYLPSPPHLPCALPVPQYNGPYFFQ